LARSADTARLRFWPVGLLALVAGLLSVLWLAFLSVGMAAVTALLLLTCGLWAWRRRDAFALLLAGAAGAFSAVVLTIVAV
jgi:hypothetical protein